MQKSRAPTGVGGKTHGQFADQPVCWGAVPPGVHRAGGRGPSLSNCLSQSTKLAFILVLA